MKLPAALRSPATLALISLAVAIAAALATAGGAVPPNLGAALIVAAASGAAVSLLRLDRRAIDAGRRLEETAKQLDRRISELFSLQELSYVLSESIELDRIVEHVVRYAARFLQAEGALVALPEDGGTGRLHIAASIGTLAGLQGKLCEQGETALVRFALTRERIEVAQGMTAPSVHLIGGMMVRSAAVAPLRSQGVTVGALAVADRRDGQFTTEDLWLLSTVATQMSVVVANSRLFEMVRRSTEEWETAFNALTEGIAVVGADGTVLRANRALSALAGAPEQDLVGRDFAAGVAGGSELVRKLIAAAYRRERPAPAEVRLDRDRRVLRLTAAPLTGSVAGGAAVMLVEDVTEQRALEAQLILNEKMASIGQLVSGVAHELNNPLTSIAGLAELLLEPNMLPDGPREHMRVIHDQAERANRIVRNLLTFARQGSPEKESVDLNDVVARTSLLISYELKLRGVELESRPSSDPVLVLGDRYELQQVLLNVVTNSVQALSDLEPGRPRRITLTTSRSDDQAWLRISDTGPGVPPALIPHLFTPFFTTKGPGQGTGLGLSLSYGLIESHGGRIFYQPAREGGAEFVITLPVRERAEAGGSEREQAGADGKATETGANEAIRRILVVDDDPGAQRLLGALFKPDGHLVETARTGAQGMRLAERHRYDLIIADGQVTTGADQFFVSALLGSHPEYRDRLIVAGSPRASGPLFVAARHWVAKPFNLRDLRALAGTIFRGA